MNKSLLLLSLLSVLLASTLCEAKTKRYARVKVVNRTGKPVRSVTVVHKYSDNYKHKKVWDFRLRSGRVTSDSLLVEYNTGFLTTGRDWWVVSYVSDDGKTLTVTDPQNFRSFLDGLEKVAHTAYVTVASATVGASPAGPAGGAVAGIVANSIANQFFNSESTSGFKQHILRKEDEGKVTKIILLANGKVRFESPSGNSETGTESRYIGN